MYMHKPRGLNIGESYACNRASVRKAFEGQDISVGWGIKRSFAFDFQMRRLPRIEGTVVASLSINHRLRNPQEHSILNFYIISDPDYGIAQKQLFDANCLPRLRSWYDAHVPQRLRGGIDELLVSWDAGRFRFIEIHFA